MHFTRKQWRRARLVLQILVALLTWQFAFPQHAFAQVVESTPEVTEQTTTILPPDVAPAPAVPPAVLEVPKPPVPKDKPPRPVAKARTVVMTAYSSTVDQTDGDPFTTASGQKVRDGIIAMNGVPFGTKVRIPEKFGNKVFVVQDRMNSRYGSARADIWMKTRHDAKQWGVKRVKVEILK
ncbi:MAG: hypothetical protein WCV85_05250 [Patescibacteria group bacterium]|jgi:3D (Asp-Asp-Asp) domain-containing protein